MYLFGQPKVQPEALQIIVLIPESPREERFISSGLAETD